MVDGSKSMHCVFLMISLIVIVHCSVVSYKITRMKTTACQEMWIALEDKRTYLTRLAEEGDDVKDFDRKKALDATRDPRVIVDDDEDE